MSNLAFDPMTSMKRAAKYVIATTEICGGHIVVCQFNALGPVVAQFPRTNDGFMAATQFIEAHQ